MTVSVSLAACLLTTGLAETAGGGGAVLEGGAGAGVGSVWATFCGGGGVGKYLFRSGCASSRKTNDTRIISIRRLSPPGSFWGLRYSAKVSSFLKLCGG